jgi:phosphatidylinositol-3-phosphatase
MRIDRKVTAGLVALVTGAAGIVVGTGVAHAARTAALPRPDHVVIVVLENHAYGEVIQNSKAPYISSLATTGATLTQSFAVTHPSQPNYLALFSGSTQGLSSDSCPHTYSGANLGQELIAAGRTFIGYSESMPSDGYTGCTSGRYARKHNPWVNFTNVPASANLRYTRFPADFTQLPAVSFVIPNLCNDMHDCSVSTGDTWVGTNLDGYVRWAKTHNSVLLLTFDEDDYSASNRIPTLFVGQPVKPGSYRTRVNHYGILRTLLDMYGLPCIGSACGASPVTTIWN